MNPENDTTTLISDTFVRGDFEIAFSKLFALPHHQINQILSKKQWLNQSEIAGFFWNSYCIKEHLMVFDGNAWETILNWYLINPDQTSDELNELLALKHPEKFINAIKRNRAFLNKPFLNRLNQYPWKNKNVNDLLIWKQLQEKHQTLQNEIDFAWQEIKNITIDSLLNSITYWNEMNFQINKANLDMDEVAREFSYLIDYISSKIILEDKDIPVKEFEENFFNDITKSYHQSVDEFKSAIKVWIQFDSTFLNRYCFDDTFEPNLTGNNLEFIFSSEKTNTKWNRIKNRYTVNNLRYFEDAIDIYDQQKESLELNIPVHFQKKP